MRTLIKTQNVEQGEVWEFATDVAATPDTDGKLMLTVRLHHPADASGDLWLTSHILRGDCMWDGTHQRLSVKVSVPSDAYKITAYVETLGHQCWSWDYGTPSLLLRRRETVKPKVCTCA